MRILLADPPQQEEWYDLRFPNNGILYLIGYLNKKTLGHLKISYLEGLCDLEDHIKAVKQFNPDIYGISITSAISHLAYRTINAVKKALPSLPIICGGAHPTAMYEEVFNLSKADICIVGEGEETFSELVNWFKTKEKSPHEINGLAFRENNRIVVTPKRQFIENLDEIPFPAFDTVNLAKYPGLQYKKATPGSGVLVSRGCPYDCIFCSNPIWKSNKPWVRLRSPENISEEITSLYKAGIREIRLYCDEFNANLKWALEVSRAIEQLGLKDLYFTTNIRVDKMSEELAENFHKANIWMVYMGIESATQRVLDGIGKKITIKQIINACKTLKKYDIQTAGFFMFYQAWEENGKLCWETQEEVNNTLKFAKKLNSEGLLDYITWGNTTPFPGSRLWKLAEKYNLFFSDKKGKYKYWAHNLNLPGISKKQVMWSLRKGALMKGYFALKKGNIDWRQVPRRGFQNLKAILGF